MFDQFRYEPLESQTSRFMDSEILDVRLGDSVDVSVDAYFYGRN